jgi:hypothetical protein
MITAVTAGVVLTAVALQPPPHARQPSASPCRHAVPVELELALGSAQTIDIEAAAGNWKIRGVDGASALTVRGRACAEGETELEHFSLRDEAAGDVLRLIVDLPEPQRPEVSDEGFVGEAPVPTATVQLEVTIPSALALRVSRSWGVLTVEGIAAVEIAEAIGDVQVANIDRDVKVHSLGGEVRVADVGRDVMIDKLRGEVAIAEVGGSVHVVRNVAGEMTVEDVGGNVLVEHDGRGDLTVARVRGSLTVERDDGGGVRRLEVAGEVKVPPPGPPGGHPPGRKRPANPRPVP